MPGPRGGGGGGETDADASTFDPKSIPDLALWLDAEKGLANQENVTNWTDQISQANARGDQSFDGGTCVPPKRVPNEIKGQSVVRFDGTSSCLVLGDTFFQSFRDFSKGFSLFVVTKAKASDKREAVIALHPRQRVINESIRLMRQDQGGGVSVRSPEGVEIGTSTNAAAFADGQVHALAVVSAAGDAGAGGFTPTGSVKLFVDGNAVAAVGGTSGLVPTTTTRSFSMIGRFIFGGGEPTAASPGYFTGDIAEIMVFRRALDVSERQQIDTYLRERWLP